MIFDEIPWPNDSNCPYNTDEAIPDFNADFTKMYQWRDKYYGEYNSGLDPDDYETEREFLYAVKHPPIPHVPKTPEYENKEYIYCGVVFEESDSVYYYRTDSDFVKIGDRVIVPVGGNGENNIATVVSVDRYLRQSVPYPIEKTKEIIKKETTE